MCVTRDVCVVSGSSLVFLVFCYTLIGGKRFIIFILSQQSALRDASHIIPTIATMLARSDAKIRAAIREVLASDPDVADLNSLSQQFSSLVVNPIKQVIDTDVKIYKVIVIDTLDECSSSWIVKSLIKAILDGVADIPLKCFILSRPENWIKRAFRRVARPSLLQELSLHDVAKSDVLSDVKMYLRSALAEVAEVRSFSHNDPPWPPKHELKALLIWCDGLFIYAATAVCYIGARDVNFRQHLTEIVRPGPNSMLQANTIDNLYLMIIVQAFEKLEDRECMLRRGVFYCYIFVSLFDVKILNIVLYMSRRRVYACVRRWVICIHPRGV